MLRMPEDNCAIDLKGDSTGDLIGDATGDSTPAVATSRRSLLRLGTVTLAAACASPWLRAQTPATPSSADAAQLQDEVWIDAARGREVPALLRWPTGGAKPQGVVIFSHGVGGRRTGAEVWGKAWADAGLLVVHLQHPGSDNVAMKGGFSSLRKAMAPEQLITRVADVKFAIDEMARKQAAKQGTQGGAPGKSWADVPLQRLALAGHSMGARTTQAIAGQAFPKAGSFNPADARVKAFVAMSPALGKEQTVAQATNDLKALTRPMLLVSGSLDGEVLNNGETVASRKQVYDCLPAGNKALLYLSGADHLTFAGIDKVIPSNFLMKREASTLASEVAHQRTTAAVTAAWLKARLLGQTMPAPTSLGQGDVWLQG
jgi:predicted dienelactone hydrolase